MTNPTITTHPGPGAPDVDDGGGGDDGWEDRQRLAEMLADSVFHRVFEGGDRAMPLALVAVDVRVTVDRWADERQAGSRH